MYLTPFRRSGSVDVWDDSRTQKTFCCQPVKTVNFSELKPGNVFKPVAAHALVGLLAVQIGTQVLTFFENPDLRGCQT
jgi:hypothetical protein